MILCFRPIERSTIESPFLEGGEIGLDRFPQRLRVLITFTKQQKCVTEIELRLGPIERRLFASDEDECAVVDFNGKKHILARAKLAAVLA